MAVWVTHAIIDGAVWVTTTSNRSKTQAWQRDPRTAAAFGVPGLGSVTLLGRVELSDDAANRQRFLDALFPRVGYPDSVREVWMNAMDTPDRVTGPILPEKYITFDERKLGLGPRIV